MSQFRNDKFTGGLTDGTLNPDPSQATELVNFLPDEFGKLVRRSGIEFYNSLNPQMTFGNEKIERIFSDHRKLNGVTSTILFFATEKDVYVSEDGGLTSIKISSVNTTNSAVFGHSSWDVEGLTISRFRDIYFLSGENMQSSIIFKSAGTGTVQQWKVVSSTLPKPINNVDPDDLLLLQYTTDLTNENSYAYAVINVFEFTTEGGVTYRMESTPGYTEVTANVLMGGNQRVINLEVPKAHLHYPNNSGGFYRGHTELFRTVDSGTTFKAMRTPAGGHSYLWLTSTANYLSTDNELLEEMYTESGQTGNTGLSLGGANLVSGYDKTIDVLATAITSSGVLWGVDRSRTMLRQSKPGAPFSWPIEFELGTSKGSITAVGQTSTYPVIFTDSTCDRIEGFLNANGVGNQIMRTISTSVGCVHQESVINFDNKVFFASTDGFYVTDGFKTDLISKDISRRYIKDWKVRIEREGSDHTRFSSATDHQGKRIFWLVSNTSGSRIIMTSFGKSAGCYEFQLNFTPTVIHYVDNDLLMSDENGYLFKLYMSTDEGERDDGSTPLTYDIDLNDGDSLMPLENSISYIDYKYKTVPISFGTEFAKKWVTKILLVLTNLGTNISLALKSINDNDADDARDMVAVFEKVPTGSKGTHVVKRRFPAGTLRSTKKQIEITPAYSILTNSDKLGLADYYPINTHPIIAPTNTEPLVILPGGGFPDITNPPTSVLLQHITFEFEGYATEHKIILVTDDTLKLLTGAGGVPILGVKWEIVGYPRDEKIRLESITMDYKTIGEGHEAYQASDSGANE